MTYADRLRQAHEGATAGPWFKDSASSVSSAREGTREYYESSSIVEPALAEDWSIHPARPYPPCRSNPAIENRANADLIVLLRNAVPELLVVLEAARALADTGVLGKWNHKTIVRVDGDAALVLGAALDALDAKT